MMLLAQTDFYYANRGMGWGFDGTYVLIILAFLISALVSAKMNATFSKYSKVRSYCGMTGAQAAQRILSSAGIYDVRIEHVSGNLTRKKLCSVVCSFGNCTSCEFWFTVILAVIFSWINFFLSSTFNDWNLVVLCSTFVSDCDTAG